MTEFSAFSWKEAVAVIEEKVPLGRYLVPITGLILVAALIVWGVGFLFENAVKPVAVWISDRSAGVDQWSALVAVMLIGFGITAVAIRQAWQRLIMFVHNADVLLKDVNDRIGAIDTRLTQLEQRNSGEQIRALLAERFKQ